MTRAEAYWATFNAVLSALISHGWTFAVQGFEDAEREAHKLAERTHGPRPQPTSSALDESDCTF